jgi:pyruvate-formate lyase-activating enzyme
MNMLSYFHHQRLTLQSGTALPAAQSLLQLAGQGELEAALSPKPDAAAVLAAIEQAYQDGYEQQASTEFELQGIAFAGSGDPLLALELLSQVLPAVKAQRHGVPVTLVTYGLVPAAEAEQLCQQLVALEVERLEIYLPAANPPAYQQAVQPLQYGFADVCQFIHTAAEAGLQVSCFAYAPVKQASEIRALAKELGARDWQLRDPD